MSEKEKTIEKTETKEESSKKAEKEPENVHSANKWEEVDLGDTDRKNKFLRLMGAAKKEHHGQFVIGEEKMHQHERESPERDVEEKLEEQFNKGLEHKLLAGPKAHIGLGFHEDPKKKSFNSEEGKDETKEGDKEKTDEKVAEKHKLDDKSDSNVPVKKKMMCNFVKASDS
ncbi:unnamed protein product [Mytilus edulis]|uniref:Small acidic protein n=1 Tax=Mytilus edulis TaxID=6550 RepID=A0A8S3QKK2_MYTED|nr:unnamed protein product [Mytilus edulis]